MNIYLKTLKFIGILLTYLKYNKNIIFILQRGDKMRSILIPAVKSLTVTNKFPNKSLNEGIITVGSENNYKYYSYLFFDISSIPCDVIIVKAELVLFKSDNFYNDNNKKLSISPLKDYFSNYTTYNNLPYYDSYNTINFYPLTSKVSISVNITTIISSWIKNHQSNKGIVLYEKTTNGIVSFTSVNSTDIPFIKVSYKENNIINLPKNDHKKMCCCNKNCNCRDNCNSDEKCIKISKEELKNILIEVCKEVCCNNCNPQPDSTVRQVRVTGTVAPLSIYFIVINIEVTRANSGIKENYYASDIYDNSLNNNPLSIDKVYNIAIIPKINPGDTENLTLYGSYKGPISI